MNKRGQEDFMPSKLVSLILTILFILGGVIVLYYIARWFSR